MTIFQFKQSAIKKLSESKNTAVTLSPSLDVEIFLSHFLNKTKTQLLMDSRNEIEEDKLKILEEAVNKRLSGLPVAYITNNKEFYGYNFYVTPNVLIPKPDTEILVENAVNKILEKMDAHKSYIPTICDMCTGSGCIALSIIRVLVDDFKVEIENLPKFTLVDISEKALDVAKKNALNLLSEEERDRITFVRSNLFTLIPNSFDAILSNPPYIPHTMVNSLLLDGRSEPRLALDGDVTLSGDAAENDDGLEIIRNLLPQAKEHLSPNGFILMETGEYNAEDTAALGKTYGFKTQIFRDLENQLRVVYLK